MHLKIDEADFSHSSTPVLEGVSLELDGPQLVSVIGPNGAGKTTLIHCISKILRPVKGSVALDGNDVNEMTLKELAKKTGYVPYSATDTFPFTVVDAVLMGRCPHSRWKSLEEDLAMRSFNELPAGQHQKVILARGSVQEPRVLLIDEPASNLDIRHHSPDTPFRRWRRNAGMDQASLMEADAADLPARS